MIRNKKKKNYVVPGIIALAVLLFVLILKVEKHVLIPATEREPVLAQGGFGDLFLPSDPEKRLIVFTKLFELFGEEHPEKLEAFPMVWEFAREVDEQEKARRLQIVETAQSWLGSAEEDGTHEPIIDLYNSHTPLARDYPAKYEDSWCSIFVSAMAIQNGMTDIIPTECGCEHHITLFQQMGCWEEADDYVPLPGDIVFYHWDCTDEGDCRTWSDHVGIVVGTAGKFIKVIEGNYGDKVGYHTIWVDNHEIRGYGLPNY